MLLSCSTFGFSQWVLDDAKAFSIVSFANLRMFFFLDFHYFICLAYQCCNYGFNIFGNRCKMVYRL